MARLDSDVHENGRRGELHVERAADKATPFETSRDERSVGELFRQLSDDSAELVRQELALAKVELRQTGATLAHDAAKVGTAVGLAFLGLMALTAFLVAGLGNILDGKYWLSALIIGALYFAIGGMLAQSAISEIKRRGQSAKHTLETVKNTATWAKDKASDVKEKITT